MRRDDGTAEPTITPETVRHTARLARLEIDEAELPRLAAQLGRIAGFFRVIAESEAAPAGAPVAGSPPADRADEPRIPADPRLGELAPDLRHGLVAVPRVIRRKGQE